MEPVWSKYFVSSMVQGAPLDIRFLWPLQGSMSSFLVILFWNAFFSIGESHNDRRRLVGVCPWASPSTSWMALCMINPGVDPSSLSSMQFLSFLECRVEKKTWKIHEPEKSPVWKGTSHLNQIFIFRVPKVLQIFSRQIFLRSGARAFRTPGFDVWPSFGSFWHQNVGPGMMVQQLLLPS